LFSFGFTHELTDEFKPDSDTHMHISGANQGQQCVETSGRHPEILSSFLPKYFRFATLLSAT